MVTFAEEQALAERYREILAPISPDHPVGIDLRASQIFDWLALKEARKGDHPGHLCPAGVQVAGPDWERVQTLATTALKRYAKDLQIAIWLLQALTSRAEWEGLRQGLFVVRELVRRFWREGLYPQDGDDGDLSGDGARALLLEWFETELANWIALVPLTPEVNGIRYSLAEYTALVSTLKSMYPRYDYWQDRSAKQELLFEIHRNIETTPSRFFDLMLKDIQGIREQIVRLASCLSDEGCSVEFRAALESVNLCEAMIGRWSAETPGPEAVAAQPENEIVDPETIVEPWQRALAWVRLQRFEKASDLIESALSSATGERSRFFLKVDLAAALFEVKRYDLAINLLQFLSEQVEQYKLQAWEEPSVAVRVWKLLYDCYQCSGKHAAEARDLETTLGRIAPWKTLR